MTHAAAWVWVLYGKASCREASRIRVLVHGQGGGGGLPWGRSVLWVTVYMLFSLTDVEFQGRPQRPEFITESECGKESPPRGKRVEKAVSLKGVPRELTPPRKRWLEYRLWTWSENLADFKIETEFYLTHTPS